MATHDLIKPTEPSRGADPLTRAIWIGMFAALALGTAAFTLFPWIRLNFFQAYETMYESMVTMSVICR